jgi:hypothetical protein
MITAEEKKRTVEGVTIRTSRQSTLPVRSYFLLGASAALVLAALIIGGIFFFTFGTHTNDLPTGFFFTERTQTYDATDKDRASMMRDLVQIRDAVNARLGYMTQIQLTRHITLESTGITEVLPLTPRDLFDQLEFRVPADLPRSFSDQLMVGVYEFDGNQPFIICHSNYYKNTFAGMLDWEPNMVADLAPLFDLPTAEELRPTPAVIPAPTTPAVGTSTAATATSTASTTAPAAPRTTTPLTPDSLLAKQAELFKDIVVSNVPVRALVDRSGTVRLLWSMPDSGTLIITSNEDTLKEILNRLAARNF